jgi:virulence factor Mce-like protein
MDRRRRNSLAANPLLIGAVTTLIVVVAVFLSYNANNGLPFVPTYNIKVELPEGAGLQPSNQVRIAGTRVGVVNSLSLRQNRATGRVTAIADLKLEKKIEPLPADTKAIVLSVSAIGLKYLELEKGSSKSTIKAGGTIPVSQTNEPVNIDELFNMFDQKTRTAVKVNTNNFGDGLAGRGMGLNRTIAELRPLVTNATPVLRNLASPATGLRQLFAGLDNAASQAGNVAESQAAYIGYLDTFFTAFASVTPSLEAATEGGPASLEQATHSLPYEAPLIEKATKFMELLRPSARDLRTVAPVLGHAFAEGAVNFKAATSLNAKLAESSQALAAFAANPVVGLSLEDFQQTLEAADPLLAGFAPVQSYCNYVTLAFRNLASLLSANIGVGTVGRVAGVLVPTGTNNQGYPASAPANGGSTERQAISNIPILNNYLHSNSYPNTAGPGQPQLCEAGNETFIREKTIIGNLPASDVTGNRELSTRETNLFGAKYLPPTLKALGVQQASAKKTTTKKTKKKGTGK